MMMPEQQHQSLRENGANRRVSDESNGQSVFL